VTVRHTVAVAILAIGIGLELIACLGIIVMRDALDRLHCGGVASFGATLVGVAIVVQESFSLIGNKALATGLVLLLTTPVLSHATARMIRVRERGSWEPRPDEEAVEVIEG
jgi:multicomponent Na+:H+ antiporter subunit G